MHVNKVYRVRTIDRVAKDLGEDVDFLFDVAIEMEPEDGLIWVLSLGDESVMAFTDFGVDSLVDLIKIHREMPRASALTSAASAGPCGPPRRVTIRRRLRLYLWRQWRTRQNRFAELRRRGVAKFAAAVAAGSPTGLWRMSGHPAVQQALRNDYFESLGLPQIYAPAQA